MIVVLAVAGGAIDAGDAAVAALLKGEQAACSASLIAPRVLLTAAHCVADDDPVVAFFGTDTAGEGERIGVLARLVDPFYSPSSHDDDLALLLLEHAPDAAEPLALTELAAGAGDVRIVGFGADSPYAETGQLKRQGPSRITAADARDFEVAPDPAGACHGDSGGPALRGGAIAGVVSSGAADCAARTRLMRVDAARAIFIAPFVDAAASISAAVGARCDFDAQCASGRCAIARDQPRLRFCAEPCAGDADCPAGMRCSSRGPAGALCEHALPSPGAPGSRCAQTADCAQGTCLESGECAGAPSPGGCEVAAHSSGGRGVLLALVLCAGRSRRRNAASRA